MHIHATKTAIATLALLGSVQAHTRFTTLFVDGDNQGDGVCVRMDMDGRRTNHPIAGLQSPEMACGRNGETGVARVCPARSGSTLTFEFREIVDGSRPGGLTFDHKGPCSVYMKKVDSAIASNNAAGDGWFKIWHEAYDEAAGKWCTSKMIDNNGHLSVTVPSDIEGGYYLVRPELLTLQAAQNNPRDPQFYVGCAQIFLESTGTAKPATITIPENYVDNSMLAMTFNIYTQPLPLPYPMFGPPAYKAGGGEADATTSAAVPGSAVAPASLTGSSSLSPDVKAAVQNSSDVAGTSDASFSDESGAEADHSANDDAEGECDETNSVESDYGTYAETSHADNPGFTAEYTSDLAAASPLDAVASNTPGAIGESSASSIATNELRVESSSSASGSGQQTEGLKPPGCVMVNGNWCGFEVKSYTDENGCWSSSAECWSQSKTCYDQAQPTGAKNCDLWNDKCSHLDDTCNAKQFTGPPDAQKDLTPSPPDLVAAVASKLLALARRHESHVLKRAYRTSY